MSAITATAISIVRRKAERAQALAGTEVIKPEAAAWEEAMREAGIFALRSVEPGRMAPADVSEVSEEYTLSNESELIPTHHKQRWHSDFRKPEGKISVPAGPVDEDGSMSKLLLNCNQQAMVFLRAVYRAGLQIKDQN